jgi:hypothetical protein
MVVLGRPQMLRSVDEHPFQVKLSALLIVMIEAVS